MLLYSMLYIILGIVRTTIGYVGKVDNIVWNHGIVVRLGA